MDHNLDAFRAELKYYLEKSLCLANEYFSTMPECKYCVVRLFNITDVGITWQLVNMSRIQVATIHQKWEDLK